MGVASAYSCKDTVSTIVEDLRSQLGGTNPALVLFFASSKFPAPAVSAELGRAFAGSQVLGCTTAGEIVSGHLLKNSVVAMAFGRDVLADVALAVVEDVRDPEGVRRAFRAFEDHFGAPMAELDFRKHLGLILIDGLSGAEEAVMDQIGDLTNVTFIGGSAGDDLKFAATHVCADGQAYRNAAVLALLRPAVPFGLIKTQSFRALDRRLVATKVDEPRREVLEFNGLPAAQAYSQQLGQPVAEAAKCFMHNPVGLMVGDEPYVRSPQALNGDRMVFYCNVKEGMELALLESTDIVADTKQALAAAVNGGRVTGIVNFHCILRTLELEQQGRTEEYGRLFHDVPTIGFSTYGEQYIGHINQTSTMIYFR